MRAFASYGAALPRASTAALPPDPANRLAVVEPGVINDSLQLAAAEHGFFWPPDPTSAAVCTIGGNLAYNAAGPRAVKYGTPRENTLGLKAVTGSGSVIRTGVMTTKGVVGYDLTRLIIGSEGTLALEMGATLEDIMVTIHPHPTLSEALSEAAEVAAGAPTHVHPARKSS